MMPARHRIGGYREFAPSRDAAFFCEAFWTHYTSRRPIAPGAAHRVLSELAVTLAFQVVRDEDGRPIEGGPILIGHLDTGCEQDAGAFERDGVIVRRPSRPLRAHAERHAGNRLNRPSANRRHHERDVVGGPLKAGEAPLPGAAA